MLALYFSVWQLHEDQTVEELLDTPIASALWKEDADGLRSLQKFIARVINPFGQEIDLCIDRSKDILQQALRKYKNTLFDITKLLTVSFNNEPGLDAGGLTREYFHLLMVDYAGPLVTVLICSRPRGGHLVPINNYDFLSG